MIPFDIIAKAENGHRYVVKHRETKDAHSRNDIDGFDVSQAKS